MNDSDRNFTPTKLKRRIEQVEASIAGYLRDLDIADMQEADAAGERVMRLKDEIEHLKARMRALKAMEAEVAASPDRQVSLTDPDARAMATSAGGQRELRSASTSWHII